ncbi:MAG: universal stress protein [Gemmatimonadaceae bacterium]
MKILVPLDTSALAERALPSAAAIATAAAATEIRLLLVHEPKPSGGYPDAPWNACRSAMERTYLDDKMRDVRAHFSGTVVTQYAVGAPVQTISDIVVATAPDLVVMTTHGRTGLSRAWLGSVADGVMRSVGVPVLMLRPGNPAGASPGPFSRVLVPLDGSSAAEGALNMALSLASSGATLVLARIVHPIPFVLAAGDGYGMTAVTDPEATGAAVAAAKEYLAKVAAGLAQRNVTAVEQHVEVRDQAAPALLALADACKVDLIAIATHGRGSARFILGSVADKVLRGSTIPLVLARRVS